MFISTLSLFFKKNLLATGFQYCPTYKGRYTGTQEHPAEQPLVWLYALNWSVRVWLGHSKTGTSFRAVFRHSAIPRERGTGCLPGKCLAIS